MDCFWIYMKEPKGAVCWHLKKNFFAMFMYWFWFHSFCDFCMLAVLASLGRPSLFIWSKKVSCEFLKNVLAATQEEENTYYFHCWLSLLDLEEDVCAEGGSLDIFPLWQPHFSCLEAFLPALGLYLLNQREKKIVIQFFIWLCDPNFTNCHRI